MYSTALVAVLLAATAVNAAAVPNKPRVIERGAGVNLRIKHDPLSYSDDAETRRSFYERNALSTRSKYLPAENDKRQEQESNTPFNNWRRDLLYSIELQVGTPAQTVEVHMDTGSADTYLYDRSCQTDFCQAATRFDHEQSSTFQRYNTTAKTTLTYGSGFAYGYWAKDTVSAGGFDVPDQVFLSASITDPGYNRTGVSGLIGFGWPGLAVSKEDPYWFTAIQNWEDKRFGCFLERRDWDPSQPRPDDSAPGGTLTLGGVDESLFTGDITYYPVTEKKFWKIEFAGLDVNGQSIPTAAGSNQAVVDTGSTLCYGPPEVVEKLYAAIPGSAKQNNKSGMWNIPCDTKADVSFKFGGESYAINSGDFIHTVVGDNVCTGAIIGQNLGTSFNWVIGDTLLKNVYSVYQYEPAAVGFAKLADGSTPPPTPPVNCPPKPARRAASENEPYWDKNNKLAWRPAL